MVVGIYVPAGSEVIRGSSGRRFASNKIRLDIISILVVLVLILSGVLTVREALSGFGDPVVILIAGLLVIGEMLVRTGVAQYIGQMILRFGGNQEK